MKCDCKLIVQQVELVYCEFIVLLSQLECHIYFVFYFLNDFIALLPLPLDEHENELNACVYFVYGHLSIV